MQNTTINVIGVGNNQFYQAKVQIFKNNKLIKSGFTHNGKITFCLEKNRGYKVIIISCHVKVITAIYTSTNYFNISLFDYCNVRNKNITFLLTDYYYNNLPIEKGEIFFDKNSYNN